MPATLPAPAAAADTAVAMEQRIRVKTANPEVRARFLSASYAPYEARIEVDLAEAPADRDAVWRAFRTAETVRARSLADRLVHGAPRAATRRDGEVEQLRQSMSTLQDDLERYTRPATGTKPSCSRPVAASTKPAPGSKHA